MTISRRLFIRLGLVIGVISCAGYWVAPACAAAPSTTPEIPAADVARAFEKFLPRAHLTHHPIDTQVVTNAMELYLGLLDYDHTMFLASDVAEFRNDATSQVACLHNGDVSVAFRVFDRFKIRARDRVEYADKLIRKGFDFTVKETYVWKRKDQPWAANEQEWNELWRKKVKNEYVARLVAREMADADKTNAAAKVDASETTTGAATNVTSARASDADSLMSPDTFLLKRYKQYLMTLEDSDVEYVLQRYFSAITLSYDPHSEYMTPSSSEDFDITMKLSLCGIGAMLQSEDGAAKIERIIPGGPAARDGRLKAGDKIIAVTQENGETSDIMHWPLAKAVRLIRGKKGSKVTLTIIPASDVSGSRTVKIQLERDEVKLEDQEAKSEVVSMTTASGKTNTLGILNLPAFYADMKRRGNGSGDFKSSARDVARILSDMKTRQVDGIVLDLRDNGGGSLPDAVEMTGLFFPSGPVVQVRESRGVQILSDPDPETLYDGPMVVLVNRRSASASEILAAALQDYGRAVIVGDSKTHGKGTVQSVQPLDERRPALGSVKVTTHSFYRVAGGSTQLKGVVPDISIHSVFDVMEVGEEHLPHAIPWTFISMAPYQSFADLSSVIPALKEKSEARRAKDPRFIALEDVINRVKTREDNLEISLNLKERVELARDEKVLDRAQADVLGEEPVKDTTRRVVSEKDFVLKEAQNILCDLIGVWHPKERKHENPVLENAWGR